MIGKKLDKLIIAKIRELRLNGRSYKEISKIVNISVSTVYLYCKDINITIPTNANSVRKNAEIGSKSNQIKWEQRRKIVKDEAFKSFDINNPKQILLSALYWGEGSKTNCDVKIANSDPNLIKHFKDLIVDLFGQQKFAARIVIYPNHNEKDETTFWTDLLKIPITIRTKKSNHGKMRLSPHGCCYLYCGGFKVFHTIMEWIRILSEHQFHPQMKNYVQEH